MGCVPNRVFVAPGVIASRPLVCSVLPRVSESPQNGVISPGGRTSAQPLVAPETTQMATNQNSFMKPFIKEWHTLV